MSFQVACGVNVSHWLSQSPARGEERRRRFTETDVARIVSLGFDHIRIPVDESQMWTENGGRQTEAFDLLNTGLDWAEGAGLRAIVDLHIIRSHFFNDEEEPPLFTAETEMERLGTLWSDLSDVLSGRDLETVAYELLNEPVARDNRRWNQVYPYALNAIREREPERTVLLGSNWYNSCESFPDLAVPEDRNLILTYHYYNPFMVTHYRTPWTRIGHYEGPIQYPGSPLPDTEREMIKELRRNGADRELRRFDRTVIRDEMLAAVGVARQHGVPAHCGEFGCFHTVPAEIRERWYRDMASVFRELGVAWSCWDYKGDFGVIGCDGEPTGIAGWLMEVGA